MGNYHYKAFISYSHRDHRWGRWLHRRLETYRIPAHLLKDGQSGRLKPIFRDREELAAADNLGEKIEQAIAASENLIIICSPQAAKSHWVNEEVLSFKRQNRGAKIFSIIVEGEPFSGDANECMPPALRFEIGNDGELTDTQAEPLAADLRPVGDGKRLGVLKLISGILGVGLDELVQRDLQRNRNRVTAITATALAVVLAMGTLTGFAVSAQKQAEAARAEADNRRDAAEGMIEFMITELKPELESVGRLKPLAIVGERAAKYYEDQPLTAHNDNALGRRARVFHLLGEIDDKHGDLDKAQQRFEAAYASTKALLARDPENADRIFDHAQSAYWVGYIPYREGDNEQAEQYFQEYMRLAKKLLKVEPKNLRSLLEVTYANTTLGSLNLHLGELSKALGYFEKAEVNFTQLTNLSDNKNTYIRDHADTIGWIASCQTKLGLTAKARQSRLKEIALTREALKSSASDKWELWFVLASSMRHLSTLYILDGEYDKSLNTSLQSEAYFLKLTERDPINQTWLEGLAYSQRVLLNANKEIKDEQAFNYVLSKLQSTLEKLPAESRVLDLPNFQNLTFE